MKIEIGAYTLCAGALESPEELSRAAEDQLQTALALRATEAKSYNRGNRTHSFRFRLTRTYASIAAAEVALLDHPAEVPATGTVKFTVEGASPAIRYLHAATCHAFAARQIGCSIQWDYTITGGTLDSTP